MVTSKDERGTNRYSDAYLGLKPPMRSTHKAGKYQESWRWNDMKMMMSTAQLSIQFRSFPTPPLYLLFKCTFSSLYDFFFKPCSDVVDLSPEENWSARRIKKWSEDNKAEYPCNASWSCARMSKRRTRRRSKRSTSKALNGREGTQ